MDQKRLQTVVVLSVLTSVLALILWSAFPTARRPSLTGASGPNVPAWLLADDGSLLPGVRTSLKGSLVMLEADGSPPHAPLNNSTEKKLYDGLVTILGAQYLNPRSSPYIYSAHPTDPTFRGLILSHASTGKSACNTDFARLTTSKQLAPLQAAWRSPDVVVMNGAPCVPDVRKYGPKILPESLTTDGISGSCETWSLFAGVCYSGFRADVADGLRAKGMLADTIKTIVVDVLCTQLGKWPNSDGTLPTFTLDPYPTEPVPGETPEQALQRVRDAMRLPYVAVAKLVARKANAVTLDGPPPDPSPRTDFDLLWELKIQPTGFTDREFAEKFWKLSKALR